MRVELLIFKNKNILDFKNLINKYTIANVYIKVNLNNISETRIRVACLNFFISSFRLFLSQFPFISQPVPSLVPVRFS